MCSRHKESTLVRGCEDFSNTGAKAAHRTMALHLGRMLTSPADLSNSRRPGGIQTSSSEPGAGPWRLRGGMKLPGGFQVQPRAERKRRFIFLAPTSHCCFLGFLLFIKSVWEKLRIHLQVKALVRQEVKGLTAFFF